MDAPSKEKAREKVKVTPRDHGCFHAQVWHHRRCVFVRLLQAMAIKEHIGYPDHILQDGNQKLDQEYAHVRKIRGRLGTRRAETHHPRVPIPPRSLISAKSTTLRTSWRTSGVRRTRA